MMPSLPPGAVLKFTIEQQFRIFDMASAQMTAREIAAHLNVSYPLFLQTIKETPLLSEILEAGQSYGTGKVKEELYKKAKDGNVPAMKGFLDHVTKTWEMALQMEGRAARSPLTIDGVARPGVPLLDFESHDERAKTAAAYAAESLELDYTEGPEDLPGPKARERGLA